MANRTIPITVTIPPRGFDELEKLASYANKLADVVAITADIPVHLTTAAANAIVASRTTIPADIIGPIFAGLSALRSMMERLEATPEDVLGAVSLSIPDKAPPEWIEKNQTKWEAAIPLIQAALAAINSDHPIIIRQKARELTYAHQNIFRSSRIITDLRPIFDASGQDIVAMVLTHVLSIEYFDGARKQHIEFALDESDVDDLKKNTERAKTKTSATRNAMSKKGLGLIVAGDTTTTEE